MYFLDVKFVLVIFWCQQAVWADEVLRKVCYRLIISEDNSLYNLSNGTVISLYVLGVA